MSRLNTTFDLPGWYQRVRASGQPVAWCSAFAPAEALLALGVIPVYPENHAAMLGALSETHDPDRPYARAAITAAEGLGLGKEKGLCSYALADLGVLIGGAVSPIGGLPEPALFYACDSQCAVVGRWGEVVREFFRTQRRREVSHYLLRAPSRTGAKPEPEEIAAFGAQLSVHLDDIAKRLNLRRDEARLAEVVAESARANWLWQACLELGRRRPAPWTAFDAFTAMAPIVVARGTAECTDFYRRLLTELEERVAGGFAAVPNERVRLAWDAIPIWPRKNWLAKFLAERGAAVVASTYTHSWWFDFDPARPFATLAERYAWNTMNRDPAWVLDWTLGLVKDYGAAGIIAHRNRSCGRWNSYVQRRLPSFAVAGVPCVVIEADMVDSRAFDEAAVARQLEDFLAKLSS